MGFNVGDKVMATRDYDLAYTTDPVRYSSLGQKGFIKAGDVMVVTGTGSLNNQSIIRFSSHGGYSNNIPIEYVKKVDGTESTTKEVVGGTYKVVSNKIGWSNPKRGKNELFQAGDTLVAIDFIEPTGINASRGMGRCVKHTTDAWYTSFPLCELEFVVGSGDKTMYKAGDRVVVVSDDYRDKTGIKAGDVITLSDTSLTHVQSESNHHIDKAHVVPESTLVVGGKYRVLSNKAGNALSGSSFGVMKPGDIITALRFDRDTRGVYGIRHHTDNYCLPLDEAELIRPAAKEVVGGLYRILSNSKARYNGNVGPFKPDDTIIALAIERDGKGDYGIRYDKTKLCFPLDEVELVREPSEQEGVLAKPKAKEVVGATYRVLRNDNNAGKFDKDGKFNGDLLIPGDIITAGRFEKDSRGTYGIRHHDGCFCTPLEDVEYVADPVIPEQIVGAIYRVKSNNFRLNSFKAGMEFVATRFADNHVCHGCCVIPFPLWELELVAAPVQKKIPPQVVGGTYKILSNEKKKLKTKGWSPLAPGDTIVALRFGKDGCDNEGIIHSDTRHAFPLEEAEFVETIGATYKVVRHTHGWCNPTTHRVYKEGDIVVAIGYEQCRTMKDKRGVRTHKDNFPAILPLEDLELVVVPEIPTVAQEVIGGTYRCTKTISGRANPQREKPSDYFHEGDTVVAIGFEDSPRPSEGRGVLYRSGSWSIPLEHMELVEPSEVKKVSTPQEIVGATYRIIRNSQGRLKPGSGKEFKEGELVTALGFGKGPGDQCTHGLIHTDSAMYFPFPMTDLEFVSAPTPKEVERVVPAKPLELVSVAPPDPAPFKAGDWVKFVDAISEFPAPSNYVIRTRLWRRARNGDVTQIMRVYKDKDGVWTGQYQYGSDRMLRACKLCRLVATEPPVTFPYVRVATGLIATASTIPTAYYIHKEFDMRHVLESFMTDPSVHAASVRMYQGVCLFLGGSLGYVGVTRVIKGVGQIADRRRRLKKEDSVNMASTIADAIKQSKV